MGTTSSQPAEEGRGETPTTSRYKSLSKAFYLIFGEPAIKYVGSGRGPLLFHVHTPDLQQAQSVDEAETLVVPVALRSTTVQPAPPTGLATAGGSMRSLRMLTRALGLSGSGGEEHGGSDATSAAAAPQIRLALEIEYFGLPGSGHTHVTVVVGGRVAFNRNADDPVSRCVEVIGGDTVGLADIQRQNKDHGVQQWSILTDSFSSAACVGASAPPRAAASTKDNDVPMVPCNSETERAHSMGVPETNDVCVAIRYPASGAADTGESTATESVLFFFLTLVRGAPPTSPTEPSADEEADGEEEAPPTTTTNTATVVSARQDAVVLLRGRKAYKVDHLFDGDDDGAGGAEEAHDGEPPGNGNEPLNEGDDGGDDESDSDACVICYSSPRDTVCLPCRHLCMCAECAALLRAQNNKCPMCRTDIQRLMKCAG